MSHLLSELFLEQVGVFDLQVLDHIVEDLRLPPHLAPDIGRIIHHHDGHHSRDGEEGGGEAVEDPRRCGAGADEGGVGAGHPAAADAGLPVQLPLYQQADEHLQHLGRRPCQDG